MAAVKQVGRGTGAHGTLETECIKRKAAGEVDD